MKYYIFNFITHKLIRFGFYSIYNLVVYDEM